MKYLDLSFDTFKRIKLGERRKLNKILVGKSEVNRPLGGISIHESMILK
jgi:hypothetical protein